MRTPLSDLEDCHEQLEALLTGETCDKIGKHNDRERSARVKLVELCETIAELFEDERRLSGREGATVEDIINAMEERQAEQAEENDE